MRSIFFISLRSSECEGDSIAGYGLRVANDQPLMSSISYRFRESIFLSRFKSLNFILLPALYSSFAAY